MSEPFYIHDYRPVLLRIADKGVTSNQVINLLPRDRESIFPQTEASAACIRSDPIQYHNFRAWVFTMLGLLGFECTDPEKGYYRLVAEPTPTFLGKKNPDPESHSSSFDLLQRCLLSMALVGLGHHVKQVYNHMIYLFLHRRLVPSQSTHLRLFFTWCNVTLFKPLCLDIPPPFPPPEDTPAFEGKPISSFEFRVSTKGSIMLTLSSCKHGILANYDDKTFAIFCRVPGEQSCGFSIKGETRELEQAAH